eukprot:TRINITY_DN33181_c0_g1_i1.p1 TRINITY_DN33181_c0_g1~~TRINITY_DN33181_c0_g1_i1.p1  ORF type:complete len:354 (-),score=57.55 TRINITY_DN33181_c0_g1_i1:153-1136(-)
MENSRSRRRTTFHRFAQRRPLLPVLIYMGVCLSVVVYFFLYHTNSSIRRPIGSEGNHHPAHPHPIIVKQSPSNISIHTHWSHATNDRHKLYDAVSTEDIQVLEGDVRFSKVHGEVVMAHDVGDINDHSLPLIEWIQTASMARRGIKIDFKDPVALNPALELLLEPTSRASLSNIPIVLLNADIVAASNKTKLSFNCGSFVNVCVKKLVKHSKRDIFALSLGLIAWNEKRVTHRMVTDAVSCCYSTYDQFGWIPRIIWAVNAAWVDQEVFLNAEMDRLLSFEGSSIVYWGSKVPVDRITWLSNSSMFQPDQVSFDLTEQNEWPQHFSR